MGCAASTAAAVEEMQAKAGDAKHAAQQAMLKRNERKHDEKLIGLDMDVKVLKNKETLRDLRDACDNASEVYRRWCTHTTDGLLLPSLSVLARRDDFVGGADAALKVQNVAAHCAELTKVQMQARAQFGKLVQAEFRAAIDAVKAGLDEINGYEKAAIAARALEDDAKKPKPKPSTTPDAIAEANAKVESLKASAGVAAYGAVVSGEAKVAEAFRMAVVGYEKLVDVGGALLDDGSIGEVFKAYQPKYATTTASAAIGGVTMGGANKSKTVDGQEVNEAMAAAQAAAKNCALAKAQLNAFAQKGLATLFGPRTEDETLDRLKAVLGDVVVKGAAPKPSAAFAEKTAAFSKQTLLPLTNALDAHASALEGGVILAAKEYKKAAKELAALKKGEDASTLEALVAEKAAATRAEVAKLDVSATLVAPLETFMGAYSKLLTLRGSTGAYAKYKADYIAKHGAEEVAAAVELEAAPEDGA